MKIRLESGYREVLRFRKLLDLFYGRRVYPQFLPKQAKWCLMRISDRGKNGNERSD
jgi:hypothetical protein